MSFSIRSAQNAYISAITNCVQAAYQHYIERLGKPLIAFAENKAREQDYTSIDLYTHELMTENIALYQRLDYTIIEHRTEHGYQRVYMRKML